MDLFSPEHLAQLQNKRAYLTKVLGEAKRKINHRNWVVTHNFGPQIAGNAIAEIQNDLARVQIEIDFLIGFLEKE